MAKAPEAKIEKAPDRIAIMQEVMAALKPLTAADQLRVIKAVAAFYDIPVEVIEE